MTTVEQQNLQQVKRRIDWVDLAKGFCIILVVFHHVAKVIGANYLFDVQVGAFRMPLYFILSGLFFKQYEGFVGFLKRKTNKLLIPFLFFFITTAVIPYLALIIHEEHPHYFFTFKFLYLKHEVMFNEPIWFLLGLFVVNILFYGVQWLAGVISAKYKTWLVVAFCVIIGFAGLALGVGHVSLPLFLDTAMSALPLFAFGWWLFRHTDFMTVPAQPIRDIVVVALCLLVLWFLAVPVKWYCNGFSRESIGVVYLCGIAGTMMVLTVSKWIRRLPVVSYCGRYSIMVLCIHYPVATIVMTFLDKFISDEVVMIAVVFVITMAVSYALIPFMLRFMPHVTAQKDVIKVP